MGDSFEHWCLMYLQIFFEQPQKVHTAALIKCMNQSSPQNIWHFRFNPSAHTIFS